MPPSIRLALIVILAATLSSTALRAENGSLPVDDKLIAMEKQKWTPQLFSSPEQFMALFASDFVSVEYGADVQGGGQRKTRAEVFSGPPLPPATFDLSDFKVIHPDPDSAIVSYKVTGKTFAWRAWASSVWARRHGKWVTVFYQASTAK